MTFLFDLDGTLLNTLTDLTNAVNFALKRNRLSTLEENEMRLLVGNGVSVLCERAAAITWHRLSLSEQQAYLELAESASREDSRYREDLLSVTYAVRYKEEQTVLVPLQLTDAVTGDFLEYYAQHSMDQTAPYPGIIEMLTGFQAAGHKLAVISNKADPLTRDVVNHYFSEIDFDQVLGMRSDLSPKPDPAGALQIAGQLEVKPEDVFFVGDSMTDMKTAVNAGMHPIGVSWGFRSVEELLDNGAKTIVHSPEELERIQK